MASNRAVVYMGPRTVEVQSIDYPKLVAPDGRKCNHGVIVKLVSTNICGSNLHMYRGRTSAPKGTVFGRENTGEVIEARSDVEYIKVGDIVSIPFNIACGRCRNCKARFTNLCQNTNPAGIGGAYGFVGMGGWKGGQEFDSFRAHQIYQSDAGRFRTTVLADVDDLVGGHSGLSP